MNRAGLCLLTPTTGNGVADRFTCELHLCASTKQEAHDATWSQWYRVDGFMKRQVAVLPVIAHMKKVPMRPSTADAITVHK